MMQFHEATVRKGAAQKIITPFRMSISMPCLLSA